MSHLNHSVDDLTKRSLYVPPTTALLIAIACLLAGAAITTWILGLILTQTP